MLRRVPAWRARAIPTKLSDFEIGMMKSSRVGKSCLVACRPRTYPLIDRHLWDGECWTWVERRNVWAGTACVDTSLDELR